MRTLYESTDPTVNPDIQPQARVTLYRHVDGVFDDSLIVMEDGAESIYHNVKGYELSWDADLGAVQLRLDCANPDGMWSYDEANQAAADEINYDGNAVFNPWYKPMNKVILEEYDPETDAWVVLFRGFLDQPISTNRASITGLSVTARDYMKLFLVSHGYYYGKPDTVLNEDVVCTVVPNSSTKIFDSGITDWASGDTIPHPIVKVGGARADEDVYHIDYHNGKIYFTVAISAAVTATFHSWTLTTHQAETVVEAIALHAGFTAGQIDLAATGVAIPELIVRRSDRQTWFQILESVRKYTAPNYHIYYDSSEDKLKGVMLTQKESPTAPDWYTTKHRSLSLPTSDDGYYNHVIAYGLKPYDPNKAQMPNLLEKAISTWTAPASGGVSRQGTFSNLYDGSAYVGNTLYWIDLHPGNPLSDSNYDQMIWADLGRLYNFERLRIVGGQVWATCGLANLSMTLDIEISRDNTKWEPLSSATYHMRLSSLQTVDIDKTSVGPVEFRYIKVRYVNSGDVNNGQVFCPNSDKGSTGSTSDWGFSLAEMVVNGVVPPPAGGEPPDDPSDLRCEAALWGTCDPDQSEILEDTDRFTEYGNTVHKHRLIWSTHVPPIYIIKGSEYAIFDGTPGTRIETAPTAGGQYMVTYEDEITYPGLFPLEVAGNVYIWYHIDDANKPFSYGSNYVIEQSQIDELTRMGKRTLVLERDDWLSTYDAVRTRAQQALGEVARFYRDADMEVHYAPGVRIGDTIEVEDQAIKSKRRYLIIKVSRRRDGYKPTLNLGLKDYVGMTFISGPPDILFPP